MVVGAVLFGLLIVASMIYEAWSEADIRERVRAAKIRRGEDPNSNSNDTPLRPIVSAENLIAAYEENEVAADQQYKGKSIVVTGTVSRIGKDLLNTMYVATKGRGLWEVQCMFDDSQEGKLAGLSKGTKVTLIGTVRGKMGNVILKDCAVQ